MTFAAAPLVLTPCASSPMGSGTPGEGIPRGAGGRPGDRGRGSDIRGSLPGSAASQWGRGVRPTSVNTERDGVCERTGMLVKS